MSSYTTPSLSYLSSVDLSTSNGTTLYNIQIDEAMVNDGNILMFEYKLQEYTLDDLNPTPTDQNVTLGFINLENCNFTSGVANVWQISVPVLDNSNLKNISVRVYIGLTGSTGIVVSSWSNTLNVYNPPAQPSIHMSYYDAPSLDNADELFVLMNIENSHSLNVRYIVAYYYTNDSGDIVWAVSEQLQPSLISHLGTTYNLLRVANFGKVSQSSPVLYAAVYAVLPFSYDEKNYYSVSKISDTVVCEPSEIYNAPIITSIVYSYSLDSEEIAPMTINWSAPLTAVVNTFQIDKYILSMSLNGEQWEVADNNVSNTSTSYVFDVTEYGAGDLLNFKLQAVSTFGTLSPESNQISKYTFRFSSAPLDLEVFDTSYSTYNGLSISFKFKNPLDTGYGAGVQFGITIDGETMTPIPYNASTPEYIVNLSGLNVLTSGLVVVSLQTQDTNSTDLLSGYSIEAPYISADFVVDSIDYAVYNNGSQDMTVSWSSFLNYIAGGWTVDNYDVYLSVSGINPAAEQLIATTTSTSTVYTATQAMGNTLSFRVVANLSLGQLSFSINSLSLSKNIFKYPTIPGGLAIDYATILVDENGADSGVTVSVIYNNNANTSSIYSSEDDYWVIQVFDSTYDPSGSNTVIASTVIPYDGSATQYTAAFNSLPFLQTGYINVYLVANDTNSESMLNGAASFVSFTASRLPVPAPPMQIPNTNKVKMIVNTLSLLTPSGTLWVNFTQYPFLVASYSSYTYNPNNGIYRYEFILDPLDFGLIEFPSNIYILLSNQTGPIISFLGFN